MLAICHPVGLAHGWLLTRKAGRCCFLGVLIITFNETIPGYLMAAPGKSCIHSSHPLPGMPILCSLILLETRLWFMEALAPTRWMICGNMFSHKYSLTK